MEDVDLRAGSPLYSGAAVPFEPEGNMPEASIFPSSALSGMDAGRLTEDVGR